jgi:hypothetical protein
MLTPRARHLLSFAALMTGVSLSAQAGLGEPVLRIEQDRLALRAAPATVTHAPSYDRHELRAADGTVVHEFADRAGRVFAITFEGPVKPDLKVLLSDRYAEYAARLHASPSTHKVYTHMSSTLQLSIIKGPRAFLGSAVLPGAAPAGFDPRDLH